jgi:hypothetical protein
MKANTGGQIAVSGGRTFQVTRGNRSERPRQQRLRDIIRDALPTTENGEINAYRIGNFLNVWRGFWRIAVARFFTIGHSYGAVCATLVRGDGRRIDLGLVSLRVVTTVGVGYIVDAFQNSVEAENMKFHAFGTGTTAEAAGDTALVTELTNEYVSNVRPTGSQTEGASANIYRSVAHTLPDSGGVFTSPSTAYLKANAAGVLPDRSKFSAINLDLQTATACRSHTI